MAMKVVAVLFIAIMLILTEHNAMAGTFTCLVTCSAKAFLMSETNFLKCMVGCGTPCTIGCSLNNKKPEDIAKCLVDCGVPCPAKCTRDYKNAATYSLCLIGCFSPIVNEEIETPNTTTAVCTVGCSLSVCSEFINETVVIPHLHFDLVDSGRYKDFPWGSLSFEDLVRSLTNQLKAGGQFYLIQGMSLAIQVWLYECCSSVPPKIASKVVFKNIEPTKKELAKLQIPKKDAIQHERSIDSDDDFQDSRPRKINEQSKKKTKVDSSTPATKKSLRKKQVSSSKMKKGKEIARVIFPQVQSKTDSYVEEVVMSKPQNHVEKEAFISKKDFDPFCNEDPVVDMEADKSNIDEGELQHSGQHFSPDVVQSLDNISEDKDPELQNMAYVGTKKSLQQLSLEVDQELEASLLGTKGCTDLHSEKMNIEIDSQQLIPNGLLRNINLNYLHSDKVVQHDCRTSDEKINETILSDSQFTIPDEMLPSLNAYRRQSIIIHPSANRQEESHHEIFDARTSDTVLEDQAQIEKIVKIISLYLQGCDFYVKKGIDLQNHPRYKDKHSSDMFDILFEDDLPQQPSGSLDCGVFMVMYGECLSYGHKVIPTEFDPNALRTRYASLLWDYGIQKKKQMQLVMSKHP
ncbi:hypothetical protein CQW23_23318 [Capsicum baccatum]|uniref:Ubiquitin-like protease family profile domain-containing protein n=1 Tax=Capsicum baccatum TaxID=33114 RepID=A0A2G2VRM2_CAPBA|nr:hypothetical protein CQW23_23318 [Capsicum baccatum]